MITSNKQRQEHINTTTIQRAKVKGAHERFKSLQFVKAQNPNANPNKNGQGSR